MVFVGSLMQHCLTNICLSCGEVFRLLIDRFFLLRRSSKWLKDVEESLIIFWVEDFWMNQKESSNDEVNVVHVIFARD